MSVRDVVIVGAGPSGLATAIACRHFGLDYLVLEQGALVDAIVRFPINMVFFTTPELMEIGGIPLTTPYEKPTRLEALRYYSLGLVQHSSAQYAKAIPFYQHAIEVDPHFAIAYARLATCYNFTKQFDLAREASSKAYEFRDRASELIRSADATLDILKLNAQLRQ